MMRIVSLHGQPDDPAEFDRYYYVTGDGVRKPAERAPKKPASSVLR